MQRVVWLFSFTLTVSFLSGCGGSDDSGGSDEPADPQGCSDGASQNGTTACGLNDEGVFVQDCTAGAWVDSATCTGTDVCVNGATQNGTTACGANAEGVFVQDCTAGAWVDSATCTGTDACTNGTTQDGTTTCGLNAEGVLVQDCTEGAWVDSATCTGTDVCTNGTTQNGTTVCGANAEGVLVQDCTEGAWVDSATCTGTDACTNGTTQDGTTTCGLNAEGVLVQDCTEGAWVDSATCTGTDVCTNGTTQNGTTVCGANAEGFLAQDCTSGAWADSATCTGTDVCTNGTTQDGATACGLNAEGVYVQDCTSGAWVDSASCTGTDICVNDSTQPGINTCGLEDRGLYQQSCPAGAWTDTVTCVGRVAQGYLKAYGADLWKFEATSGVAVTMAMDGKDVGSAGFSGGAIWETFVDLYDPSGVLVAANQMLYSHGGGSTPYTFTPSETGVYIVYAHGYLNDTGGYELSASANDLMLVTAPVDATPTPSDTPLTFFVPDSPTEDWTHTDTGDLATDKPFETWVFSGLVDQNLKIDLAMVAPFPNDRQDLVEPYVYLFDASGNLIASDDDTGPGKNARIYHTLTATGEYRVVATTYGRHHDGNWSSPSGTGWDLGDTGLGHYDLTIVAKTTMDFVKEDLVLSNPEAVKINAILLTDDAELNNALMDQAGVESLISDLNADFATLYPLTHWAGFELASVTRFYEPDYYLTGAPHEALAELGNTPAALQDHVNVIILDVDSGQTGIVGTTNLRGSILGPRGATLVLEHDAGSGVFIHEMGHVIGVQHLAGSWPPRAMELERADGSMFGYWTFACSNPESSYMSNWDSMSYDSDFASKSWYLTDEANTLNSSTHGRLFAEALRTWLVDNDVIAADAPPTTYGGPSSGEGIATGYWTWDDDVVALQNNGVPDQAIFPSVATSSSASNAAAAVVWEGVSSDVVLLRYRNGAGAWEDAQSITAAGGTVGGSRVAMDSEGNAIVIWQPFWGSGIEVSFHGKNDASWGAAELISSVSGAGAKTLHSSIALNDNGEAVAVWSSRADSSSNYQIVLRERAADGTWSDPTLLYDDAALAAFPEVALNADGDVLAVWQEMVADVLVVRGRYRNGDDDSWTAAESYSGGVNHAGLAQPVIDASGNGLIYWREADSPQTGWTLSESGHVSVRARSSAGVLGSVVLLSEDGSDSFHTAAISIARNSAFTDGGGAVAAWSGFDGSDFRIYVALMAADGTWGLPTAISAAGQNAKLPRIAVGESGVVAVSWERSDGLHSRIQASVYSPASQQWAPAVSLSAAGELAFWSGIDFDGNGQFTVVWSRSDGSHYKLESKQATLVAP